VQLPIPGHKISALEVAGSAKPASILRGFTNRNRDRLAACFPGERQPRRQHLLDKMEEEKEKEK
jgi:hypothetical protein